MKIPQSNTSAHEHSLRLSRLIQEDIQRNEGYIPFTRFMELALYAPGLGYYSAGSPKFGVEGDFVTAPEISPIFAQCLARQCQQILTTLKTGDILELGAGTGQLAKELLLELETLNCLPQHYFILETSADLRDRQQTLLNSELPSPLYSRITWLDSLPKKKISGIILANEVLDALPVHCFAIQNKIAYERCVTWKENQFTWQLTQPTTPELTDSIRHLQTEYLNEENYESEINLLAPKWVNSIGNSLETGVILLFDYGYGQREYYHPDRTQGTLMCYYQHHRHTDPFQFVGLQDITAHVDFTRIIENAITADLSLGGYTTQSHFLMACGLLEITQKKTLSEKERFRQNQAIKTLTLPSQMGEAIKVMGLTKNWDNALLGFSLHDRVRDL